MSSFSFWWSYYLPNLCYCSHIGKFPTKMFPHVPHVQKKKIFTESHSAVGSLDFLKIPHIVVCLRSCSWINKSDTRSENLPQQTFIKTSRLPSDFVIEVENFHVASLGTRSRLVDWQLRESWIYFLIFTIPVTLSAEILSPVCLSTCHKIIKFKRKKSSTRDTCKMIEKFLFLIYFNSEVVKSINSKWNLAYGHVFFSKRPTLRFI